MKSILANQESTWGGRSELAGHLSAGLEFKRDLASKASRKLPF